jgi:hypothetical protein
MSKRMMRVLTPSTCLQVARGLVLSDPEKAEALADSLKAHFRLVDEPSDRAGVDIYSESVNPYKHIATSKSTLKILLRSFTPTRERMLARLLGRKAYRRGP